MREEKRKKIIGIGIVLFLLDRLVKLFFIYSNSYTINYGISGGILLYGYLVILLSTICIIGILFYSKRNYLGGLLILIGGISNLIDRIIYGGVIDYIKIPIINITNNFSDILIFLGSIVLLVDLAKKNKLS